MQSIKTLFYSRKNYSSGGNLDYFKLISDIKIHSADVCVKADILMKRHFWGKNLLAVSDSLLLVLADHFVTAAISSHRDHPALPCSNTFC